MRRRNNFRRDAPPGGADADLLEGYDFYIIKRMQNIINARLIQKSRQECTFTGIFPIFACHSRGPVSWTFVPLESTATVTGMSCTSNS